jgi:Uma2 family endonuclease
MIATLEDLLAVPEEERRRVELIEGVLTDRGATSGEHGMAQFRLSGHLGPFDRRPGGRWPGGWWLGAGVDVYFDAANTLRPDVSGWRRDRVAESPRGLPVMVRPDWICEVLSSNKRNDLVKKKRVYHRHRVPHYWIVDPEQETLLVDRWAPEGYMEVVVAERGDVVRAEPFDAVPLAVAVVFGDDEEETAE